MPEKDSRSMRLLQKVYLSCAVVAGFPGSENPVMLSGPVEVGDRKCKEIDLINRANFTEYDQVISQSFEIPSDACTQRASIAVLVLDGKVSRGRQYDRVGGIWIDDVEMLRLSTPEPNNETDIYWKAERDVSDYIDFLRLNEHTTRVSIPNEVTSVYTGIISVNLTLQLYSTNENRPRAATSVSSLIKPDFTDQNPLSSLSVSSGEAPGLSTNASIDFAAERIVLRLLASAHGNEEFWYSNVPGASFNGIPGGGVYREFVITIDGVVAGTAPAFPFVYSGGLNPLAWRPLAGIGSFAIPSYDFDLTPFAARLLTESTITVSVVSDDIDEDAVWYMSPTLLAWKRKTNITTLDELDFTYGYVPPQVIILEQNSSNSTHFISEGQSNYFVRSSIAASYQGVPIDFTTIELNSTTTIANVNHIIGEYAQTTSALATAETTVSLRRRYLEGSEQTKFMTRNDVYPIHVELLETDGSALFIGANITEARRRSVRLSDDACTIADIAWNNSIKSDATLIDIQDGGIDLGFATTNASFHISSPSTCFSYGGSASNGSFTAFNVSYPFTCDFNSTELRFCGLDLCGVEAWFYATT